MKKMKGKMTRKMTRENEKRKQMSCVFEKRDSQQQLKSQTKDKKERKKKELTLTSSK